LLAFSGGLHSLGFIHKRLGPAFEREFKAGLFTFMPKKQKINLEKARASLILTNA
jgi:hypothetical protein